MTKVKENRNNKFEILNSNDLFQEGFNWVRDYEKFNKSTFDTLSINCIINIGIMSVYCADNITHIYLLT